MNSRIGLVTGTHRSGSTWVGQTISKLSNSAYIWEPFNINSPSFYKAFFSPSFLSASNWYQFYPASDSVWLEFKNNIYRKHGHILSSASFLLANEPPKKFLKYMLRLASLQVNLLTKSNFLVKDPLMLLSAESAVLSSFVDKAILLVRDPRAFYSSLLKANWGFDFTSLLPIATLPHIKPYQNVIRYYSQVKPPLSPLVASELWNILHEHILYLSSKPNFLVVRYEDICNDPVNQFTFLIKFLFDIDISSSQAHSYFADQFQDALENDAAGVQMVRRGNPALISKMWKARLSTEDEQIIINSSFRLMQSFSYI